MILNSINPILLFNFLKNIGTIIIKIYLSRIFIKNMEHIQYIITQIMKLYITFSQNFMKLKRIEMKEISKNQQSDYQILATHAILLHFYKFFFIHQIF